MVSTAGDRRDDDMRELGALAAEHFDVVVVREDNALRGRQRGEVSGLIAEGVQAAMGSGVRCKQVEVVLDELSATRHAMSRSNPGDLIVICVDQHAAVMAELESYGHQAQPGSHASAGGDVTNAIGDPDFSPENAASDAQPQLPGA
jgi:cyanophycin synthetase